MPTPHLNPNRRLPPPLPPPPMPLPPPLLPSRKRPAIPAALAVANLIDVHEAQNATHAILEYCAGGSIHRHLRSLRHGHAFSEGFGSLLVHQLSLALAHLHSMGIAHRDVKVSAWEARQ